MVLCRRDHGGAHGRNKTKRIESRSGSHRTETVVSNLSNKTKKTHAHQNEKKTEKKNQAVICHPRKSRTALCEGGKRATRPLWPAIPACPLLGANREAKFRRAYLPSRCTGSTLSPPHPSSFRSRARSPETPTTKIPIPAPRRKNVYNETPHPRTPPENAYNETPHSRAPAGMVLCSCFFYSFSVAFGILKDRFVLKKPILAGSAEVGLGEPQDLSEPFTELGVRCFVRGDLEEDLRGKQ